MRVEGKVKEYIVHTVWVDVDIDADDEEIDKALLDATIREVDGSFLDLIAWRVLKDE